jgi:hypothetical protein
MYLEASCRRDLPRAELVQGVYTNQLYSSLIACICCHRGDCSRCAASTTTSKLGTTHRFIILSPTLLLDSRLMLSPNDSNLSLSLLADRRCEVGLSAVGVPLFDACCTWTTGMGVPRFTSESELSVAMAGLAVQLSCLYRWVGDQMDVNQGRGGKQVPGCDWESHTVLARCWRWACHMWLSRGFLIRVDD